MRIFLIIFFTFQAHFFAQIQNSILAKYASNIIYSSEFQKRFELLPKITTGKNLDSVKLDFLYSMVTENIWAMEGIELGLDATSYVKNNVNYIKKMLERDNFYQDAVKNNVKLTENEIDDGLTKISVVLETEYMRTISEKKIYELWNQLNQNPNYWDELKSTKSNEYLIDTLSITFGKMEKRIEDLVYKLEKDKITKPLKTEIGWLIFKTKNIKRNTDPSIITPNKARKKVVEIISKRKEDVLSNKIYKEVLLNKKVNVDIKLFNKFCNTIFTVLSETHHEKQKDKIIVSDSDFNKIRFLLRTKLKNKYIKFSKSPISLSQFLFDIETTGLQFSQIDLQTIKQEMNSIQKNYIQEEIFSREAISLGYSNNTGIKKTIKEWEKHFIANAYIHTFNDSVKKAVGISKIEKELSTSFGTKEIISNDYLKINSFLEEYWQTNNFEKSAENNSLFWREKIYDNHTIENIGLKTDSISVGDLLGPILVNNYFHLILIEKISKYNSETEAFYSNLKKQLKRKTESLARKYAVKINYEVMKSIKVTDVNMIVYKSIGFGGKMLATPYLKDYSNLIKDYFKSNVKSPL